MGVIRKLWIYRLRFVVVFLAIGSLLLAAENLIFQTNSLPQLRKKANDAPQSLMVAETTSSALVAVKSNGVADGDVVSQLDWREEYPGLYERINETVRVAWLGGIACVFFAIGIAALIVSISAIPGISRPWTVVRPLIVLAASAALVAYTWSTIGWPMLVAIIVTSLLIALRDRRLAFTTSLVMTIGVFTLLNNRFVASRLSPERSQQRLEESHSIREDFLDLFGRRQLPDSTNEDDWFADAAKQYRDERILEALDLLEPSPGTESDKEQEKTRRLRTLLNKSDADILEEYREKFGIEFRVIPRPANHVLGIRNSRAPVFPSKQLSSPSIKTPSAEELELQLEILAGDDSGKKREGIALLAMLLNRELEAIQTDGLIVASRRANGPIQFLTLLPCIFCILTMVFRFQRNVEEPRQALRDRMTGFDEREAISPVTAAVERRFLDAERKKRGGLDDPCGEMLHGALSAFQTNYSQTDAATQVREIAETRINRMISEYNLFRYLAWVIPSIGFVGTVLGIGDALLSADKLADPSADTSAALQAVIGELGVAFDTTLVALLTSILLMFVFHRLQRREEAVVLDSQEDCLEKVVRKLTSQPKEIKELEFVAIGSKGGERRKARVERDVDLIHVYEMGVSDSLDEIKAKVSDNRVRLLVRIRTGTTAPGQILELRLLDLVPKSRQLFIENYFGARDGNAEINTVPRARLYAIERWFRSQPESEDWNWQKQADEYRKRAESDEVPPEGGRASDGEPDGRARNESRDAADRTDAGDGPDENAS